MLIEMKQSQKIIRPETISDLKVSFKKSTAKNKKHRILKRLSPFLLLAVFIFLMAPYILFEPGLNIDQAGLKLILIPCITVYIVFTDFAFLWNYFEGFKNWFIWILESFISSLIVLLLL